MTPTVRLLKVVGFFGLFLVGVFEIKITDKVVDRTNGNLNLV